jgi:hypothetical protein
LIALCTIRTWLEEHKVIEPKAEHPRPFLLRKMAEAYHKVNDPIYTSWSDNYLKTWLVQHGILEPPTQREKLLDLMKKNYWDAKDTAWSHWTDSQMREWLVSEGVL